MRTNQAREKIRAWFKHQQRDENIAQGKEILDRELRRLKVYRPEMKPASRPVNLRADKFRQDQKK